jgi:prephenate dehydratase
VKQKISSGAAGYIVDYVTSISQKHQADVLVVDWENNTHGAVFGTAA